MSSRAKRSSKVASAAASAASSASSAVSTPAAAAPAAEAKGRRRKAEETRDATAAEAPAVEAEQLATPRKQKAARASKVAPDAAASAASAASSASVATAAASHSSLASAVPAASSCLLLRCFSALDRDARFHFLSHQFLNRHGMAQLNSACREAREWMKPGSGLRLRNTEMQITPTQLQQITACSWALPLIHGLRIALRPVGSFVTLGSRPVVSLAQVAESLRSFPHLRSLHLSMGSNDGTRGEVQLLFDAVPRLAHFTVLIVQMDQAAADAADAAAAATHAAGRPPTPGLLAHCFVELDRLPHLTALEAYPIDEPTGQFNFDPLPLLPLRRLILSAAPRAFMLRPHQIRALAQCPLLAVIDCGRWSLPREAPLQHQEHFAQQSIVPFVQSRLAALAEWDRRDLLRRADPSYSSSAIEVPPTAVPLTDFNLRSTVMTRAAWDALCQLKTLRSIAPELWSVDLSPAQWARLADFRACLEEINLFFAATSVGDSPVDVDHFLPAIVQCTRLHAVRVGGVRLSSPQLASLCSLPELTHLELNSSAIAQAGLDALARACKISVLSLHSCELEAEPHQANGGDDANPDSLPSPPHAVRLRASIPALPALIKLGVIDRTPVPAAVVCNANAALLARLPLLEVFHQNLRVGAAVDAETALPVAMPVAAQQE